MTRLLAAAITITLSSATLPSWFVLSQQDSDISDATPAQRTAQDQTQPSDPPDVTLQEQQSATVAEPILVGKAGTNLQVLAIDTVEELAAEMEHFTVSLGVTCPFCHVIGGDAYGFDRDDKEQKKTARIMIKMRSQINAQMASTFGPKAVTCYTCHHGGKHPLRAPPPDTDDKDE